MAPSPDRTDGSAEEIPHTADYAFRARANSWQALLTQCARQLYALAGATGQSAAESPLEIAIEAPDRESLLVAWLNELIWRMEGAQVLLRPFAWTVATDTRLRVTAEAIRIDSLEKAVKAATYSGIRVIHDGEFFEVAVVLDV